MTTVTTLHPTDEGADEDSHSRILNLWQPPPVDPDELPAWEAQLAEMHERLSPQASERMDVVAAYVPFALSLEEMFRARERFAHLIDFEILIARGRGARPPFEAPPPPADLIEEAEPLKNPNLACVLALAAMDGYGDPWVMPGPDHALPAVEPHRLPTDRIRSRELARMLGVDSIALARALRSIGVEQRGMRFADTHPGLPGNTKGFRREPFRTALSWLVRL